MTRSPKTWIAWVVLLLGLAAWMGFVGMLWLLNGERSAYAAALSERGDRKVRGDVQSKLRVVVRDTAQERAALESAVRIPIVTAVEIIEAAGKMAGVRSLSILEASPQAASTKDISTVSVLVQAEGTFPSLVRAVALFETLPLATTVERIQFERFKDMWRISVQLRVLLGTETL